MKNELEIMVMQAIRELGFTPSDIPEVIQILEKLRPMEE